MLATRRILNRALAAICVVLFAALVVIVAWQVFTRQVMQAPSTWSTTLARYVFIWLGFFGASLVFAERGHIAMTFLVRKLPNAVQRGVSVIVQLAIVVFAAIVLIFGGSRVAALSWDEQLVGLPTQVGPMYLVLPLNGAIIVFFALTHIIAVLRSKEQPFPSEEEELDLN